MLTEETTPQHQHDRYQNMASDSTAGQLHLRYFRVFIGQVAMARSTTR